MDKRVGLLINFGGNTIQNGLRRVANDLLPSASPRLRVNQSAGIQLCGNRREPGAASVVGG